MNTVETLLNLDVFPIHQPCSDQYRKLVKRCRSDLEHSGMFNLDELLKPVACKSAVEQITPIMQNHSFEHRRAHNIYFLEKVAGLDADHPALKKVETVNHTVCADQMVDNIVMQIYGYPPLLNFLADVMQKPALFLMQDPLAQANVMSYRHGEALNWHFDRSEFTTTLLLQSPEAGGVFEYRTGLRSETDPNYAGVAKLLNGEDCEKQSMTVSPGTLNIFRGRNTAHRVTPIQGQTERMVAVFSYYETPGKLFSESERIGFYGRA